MISRITGGRATERARNRLITLTMVVLAAGPLIAAPASAETTLEKISRTGILTIGTRTGSPPFGFINDKKEWVGFSIDLVEQAVVPTLSKKLGKPIKVEKKESTPATRSPLLLANAVDLVAETMTDTPERRKQVDFSIAFFLTGAQFLVKKGSPIRGLESVGTKRIAVTRGSTGAKLIREKAPTANVREFPDNASGFQALAQGRSIPTLPTASCLPVSRRRRRTRTIGRSSGPSTWRSRTGWRCARTRRTSRSLSTPL